MREAVSLRNGNGIGMGWKVAIFLGGILSGGVGSGAVGHYQYQRLESTIQSVRQEQIQAVRESEREHFRIRERLVVLENEHDLYRFPTLRSLPNSERFKPGE